MFNRCYKNRLVAYYNRSEAPFHRCRACIEDTSQPHNFAHPGSCALCSLRNLACACNLGFEVAVPGTRPETPQTCCLRKVGLICQTDLLPIKLWWARLPFFAVQQDALYVGFSDVPRAHWHPTTALMKLQLSAIVWLLQCRLGGTRTMQQAATCCRRRHSFLVWRQCM